MWYKNIAGRFFGLVTKQPFQGYGCARQNLNGSRDLTTPFQGCLTIHWLAIATDNLPTKFEVSISTHYEDMKDYIKCLKKGWFGVVSVTQGHWK